MGCHHNTCILTNIDSIILCIKQETTIQGTILQLLTARSDVTSASQLSLSRSSYKSLDFHPTSVTTLSNHIHCHCTGNVKAEAFQATPQEDHLASAILIALCPAINRRESGSKWPDFLYLFVSYGARHGPLRAHGYVPLYTTHVRRENIASSPGQEEVTRQSEFEPFQHDQTKPAVTLKSAQFIRHLKI